MNREFRHVENSVETGDTAYVEQLLERLFESESINKANEGHHGVILGIDLNAFTEKEKAEFCRYFQIPPEDEDKLAIKMLKLYQANEAEKEFSAQEKASEAINGNPELAGKVGVPECYFGGEIAVKSAALQNRLKGLGVGAEAGRLGMIMMDFIDGQDLGIFCYKEFIKVNFDKYKELLGMEQEIDPQNYDAYLNDKSVDDLIHISHQILGVKSKYKYFDATPEAQQERHDISEMLLSEIKHRGLFEKEKISSLRQAIETMHEGGVYHRDMHLRNIVQDKQGKLFIVDFGSAKIVEADSRESEASIYRSDENEGAAMAHDEAVLSFLGQLAETPQDVKERKAEQNLVRAKKIKNMILSAADGNIKKEADKKNLAAWTKLKSAVIDGQDWLAALKQFSFDMGEFIESDLFYDYQIAGLMLLMESEPVDAVKDFCLNVLNEGQVKPILNSKLIALVETM